MGLVLRLYAHITHIAYRQLVLFWKRTLKPWPVGRWLLNSWITHTNLCSFHILTGFKSKFSASAALLVVGILQASGYTMEDMCKQMSNKGYIGNPTDCTKWGYCRSQQLVSWGSCGDGLVFQASTATCQYASEVACSTSVTQTCKALQTPGLMADPTNCANYAYCFGNGTSQIQKCPDGQNYAANNQSCVWGPECPQDSICRFMPTNIFVGDPNNCGQYLQCVQGYGISGSCKETDGSPRYFNVVTNKCQSANPCDSSNTDTDTEATTIPPTAATTCEDVGTTTEKFKNDNATCSGFFSCNKGVATWGMCPFGTAFNQTEQRCVSPAAFACEFDRCLNTNLTFAAVYGTECETYKICSSGNVANCTSDYPYYDEVYNKCVQKRPDYHICDPVA